MDLKKLDQYPAILTSHLLNNPYLLAAREISRVENAAAFKLSPSALCLFHFQFQTARARLVHFACSLYIYSPSNNSFPVYKIIVLFRVPISLYLLGVNKVVWVPLRAFSLEKSLTSLQKSRTPTLPMFMAGSNKKELPVCTLNVCFGIYAIKSQ